MGLANFLRTLFLLNFQVSKTTCFETKSVFIKKFFLFLFLKFINSQHFSYD